MATTATSLSKLLLPILFIILISALIPRAQSTSEAETNECVVETSGPCIDKKGAVPLKIIAITVILVTSMIGVSLPLVTRNIPALHPDRNMFVVVKCFAGGIILGTGFMHVLPDSFDMLSSSCLPEKPWHKFPFTGFFAMMSAIVTLMVDSMATSIYSRKSKAGVNPDTDGVAAIDGDKEMAVVDGGLGQFHSHNH